VHGQFLYECHSIPDTHHCVAPGSPGKDPSLHLQRLSCKCQIPVATEQVVHRSCLRAALSRVCGSSLCRPVELCDLRSCGARSYSATHTTTDYIGGPGAALASLTLCSPVVKVAVVFTTSEGAPTHTTTESVGPPLTACVCFTLASSVVQDAIVDTTAGLTPLGSLPGATRRFARRPLLTGSGELVKKVTSLCRY